MSPRAKSDLLAALQGVECSDPAHACDCMPALRKLVAAAWAVLQEG